MGKYYIVTFKGQFAFIKPWTAVRDSETYSQQFLTPSIVEGIEKKLFPELLQTDGILKIQRHRLSYSQVSMQQEVIQTRGWNSTRKGKQFLFDRPKAIILRGVLLHPILHLAFLSRQDAERAFSQHICLARNEDMLMPDMIREVSVDEFDSDHETFSGYELMFEENEKSFIVGFHRAKAVPMYGWLKTVGTPVKEF